MAKGSFGAADGEMLLAWPETAMKTPTHTMIHARVRQRPVSALPRPDFLPGPVSLIARMETTRLIGPQPPTMPSHNAIVASLLSGCGPG